MRTRETPPKTKGDDAPKARDRGHGAGTEGTSQPQRASSAAHAAYSPGRALVPSASAAGPNVEAGSAQRHGVHLPRAAVPEAAEQRLDARAVLAHERAHLAGGHSAGTPRPVLQRKPQPGAPAAQTSAQAILAQLGPGRPLDAGVRDRMEVGLGASLAHVRVHDDRAAHAASRDVSARAFTVGSHIAFGAGEYRPGSLAGDALIAHELAHTLQQRAAGRGPEGLDEPSFDSPRHEREADHAAASVLGGLRPPALSRSGLRLQRCFMPSTAERDQRTIDQVRADLEREGALGPRVPVRALPGDHEPLALGEPSPLSASAQRDLSDSPPTLTAAETVLDLGTLEAQLEALAPILQTRATGVAALAAARARIAEVRGQLGTGEVAAQSKRILRTKVVLGQSRGPLENLQLLRGSLAQPGMPHGAEQVAEVDRVAALFDAAVGRAAQDDVLPAFRAADRAAQELPMALLGAHLRGLEGVSSPANLMQGAVGEIRAWAGRLRPRLTALEARAGELAAARRSGAANVQELEARFRDESDAISLSIEALTHFEQLVLAFDYMRENGSLDARGYDVIPRLMTRVRHMRDADLQGDVALLEVLVRRYREDEAVQTYLRNLHVFVGFTRIASTLGIVLIASIATAGVGAAATAAIGTTSTAAGAATAFAGVTVLEAMTFTAVSRGLQGVLPGQEPHTGFWVDFAWNLGLFGLLRGSNLGVARGLRSMALPPLTRLVQHTTSYPLLMGYGVVRHRVERGEWPTSEQLDQMAAENLILLFGLTIGMAPFRNLGARQPREVRLFRQRYGLQFHALSGVRDVLHQRVRTASEANPATRDAVTAEVAARARTLEAELRQLVDQIRADPDIRLPVLREAARGFNSEAQSFALELRLLEVGLTAQQIEALQARIEAMPAGARDTTRTALSSAADYIHRVLPDLAQRQTTLLLLGRIATHPRVRGFADWVRFSTAQRPGVSPAQQARNLLDDVGELAVAEAMTASLRPGEAVRVGGDAHARTRPGTSDLLPSFDLTVEGGAASRNVEVYSPQASRPEVGHLGEAINHAADKIISDPALPAGYRTSGQVEAAVRLAWPPPNNTTGAGTIEIAANGDITLVTRPDSAGVSRRISRGNFFDAYVANLNNPARAPAGAARVNALTVYSSSGAVLFRYTRNAAGVWNGAPP